MITKDKAVDLAVVYSAFQDAFAAFRNNKCGDTARSLEVWSGMLKDLQEELQVEVADKHSLLYALKVADRYAQDEQQDEQQDKVGMLLELIKDYKATDSDTTLEAIADLVDSDYEVLCPIMTSHGITY